jgi:hypothetical protein
MTDMTLKSPVAEVELPFALIDLEAVIDRQIRAFLDGDSDGSELLRGLYDDSVDEPVPARLAVLLRR